MQHHIDILVKQFFQKNSLQEVTVGELQQFTEAYPFSAAGQFLYAKKLLQAGDQGYDDQAEKSTLYFNNPIWSTWILKDRDQYIRTHEQEPLFKKEPEETPVTGQKGVYIRPFNTGDAEVATEPVTTTETIDIVSPEQTTETALPENTEDTHAIDEAVTPESPAATEEHIPAEMDAPGAAEEHSGMDSIPTELPPVDSTTGTPVTEETPAEPGAASATETIQVQEEHLPDPEPVAQPVASATPPGEPAADTDEIPFDAYHTIDYFASQGIKLKPEDLPKDKLGQQLKSFTDWLRSMKRLTTTENQDTLDEITNQAIQQIADHSVSGKEIITEAMAEVWAKQGHREKAVAIYEKLSLLNPAKTPYFAARIEQLKAV